MGDDSPLWLITLRVLVFVGLLTYTVRLIRALRKRISVSAVVSLVSCGLAIVPLALDAILGLPSFNVFVHMRAVMTDQATEVIYLVWILPACWIIHRLGRAGRGKTVISDSQRTDGKAASRAFLASLFAALAFLPLLITIFVPESRGAYEYAAIISNPDIRAHLGYLYYSTHISVLAAAGLELLTRRSPLTRAASIIAGLIAIWLNGKRNIIVIAAFLLLIVLRMKYRFKISSLLAATVLLGSGYFVYSSWYQEHYRSDFLSDEVRLHEFLRMDYGRDTDIKMAIYGTLYPTAAILDYPGQSLLFDVAVFVPRSVWDDKPLPYYNYATPVALGISNRNLNWGITTSWLGEAIANLGWAGLFIGPLFLALLCRLGDDQDDRLLSVLTTLVCILFLTIHVAGFVPLLGLWLALIVRSRFARKSTRVDRQVAPYSIDITKRWLN